MNKSLIALAVLAAASGVASAQSTVTIYGILDANFGQFQTPGLVKQTAINSGGINSSRFGLKGSEDLGGGLKANFVLESGFQLDNGATYGYTGANGIASTTPNLFNRQSYVGFSGGFGEVKVGKPYTAYDDISGAADATWDSNIFAPNINVFSSTNYNANPGNTVYYATPSFSGFSGTASYSFGENKTTTTSAGKISSFNVKYEGGPVYVGAAYQAEKTNGTDSTKFTRINGTYDFGVAKLLAGYGRVKYPTAGKTTDWSLGVDVPVTSVLSLSAGYAHSKDDNVLGTSGKRKGFGAAAMYTLSARTYLYAGVNSTKGDYPATIPANSLTDTKGHIYAVGVNHKF